MSSLSSPIRQRTTMASSAFSTPTRRRSSSGNEQQLWVPPPLPSRNNMLSQHIQLRHSINLPILQPMSTPPTNANYVDVDAMSRHYLRRSASDFESLAFDLDTCMGGLTLDSPLSDDGKSFKKTVSESSKKDDDVDAAVNDKVSTLANKLQLSCPSRATSGNDIICDRKRDRPSSWPSSSKSLEEIDFPPLPPPPTATDITRPPKQRRVSLTPRSMQHNTHDP